MEFEGWLQIGVVLLLMAGCYILIRKPLQRKKLFDLAAAKLKPRRQARFTKKPSQHRRL